MNYRLEMYLFGGQEGKAFRQVKSHLMAEYTLGADSCPIMLLHSVMHNVAEQIKILLHRIYFTEKAKMIACWNTSPGRSSAEG